MDSNFPDVILRPGGGRRCRVLFSYSPQNDDELQLQVNDEIDFLAEVEDGWWKGRLGNKIGVFPSNFVCELNADESGISEGEISAPLSSPDSALTLDDAPVLPPKPIKEQCRVLFAYDAANDDELTLKKDDIITIITKEVEDKGWWKGELRGKIGLFPDNFVELITPPEEIIQNQQKKPDRPSKAFEKIDGRTPLTSVAGYQKIVQDNPNQKEQEELIAGLKNEGPFSKKNLDRDKPESPPTKFGEKNLNLFPVKGADSTTSHRKSLEMKTAESQPPTIVAKKPVLPPPVSNKPKPAVGKPGQVKRLSEEINDLIESSGNKFPGNTSKRLSADVHDLVDGGVSSKSGGVGRLSDGAVKEDFDLDLVERNDMLTHITSSRPKPPGRRLPTKDVKENESHSLLTNGNVETNDKEKSQKEREWEKHKPPWVNELKLNLKSSKTSASDSKFDKKSAHSDQTKSAGQSPVEVSSSGSNVGNVALLETAVVTSSVSVRQFSPQTGGGGTRVQSMFETGSKVSELSSKFSSAKPLSPPKPAEVSWNSVGEQTSDDVVHVSRKDFMELKGKNVLSGKNSQQPPKMPMDGKLAKRPTSSTRFDDSREHNVERLERMLMELTNQLCEEVDKRKLLEKELNKLTDLVTQV